MKFLTEENLIQINEKVIKKYSPEEMIGIKELGALNMIVNSPKEILFGQELYPAIYKKAAILMINLATKHVFHNGNKRTAIVAMHLFMKLNNYEANWGFQEGIDLVLWVVNEHKKTDDFERFKFEVVQRIECKYKRKTAEN